jgi:dGTPase
VCTATHARLEEANPQSVDELQRMPHHVIGHSNEMATMVRELKDYLYQHMYRHYRVVRMAQKAEHFITELFNAYLTEPEQLPKPAQARWEENGDSVARVVCDYIAGMTDRYALQEYQKLFDPFTRP